LRFTLTYQGDLPPKANSQKKWDIRRKFEPQLRRLWDIPPLNGIAKYKDPNYLPNNAYVGLRKPWASKLEFVPLICKRLSLRAELDIMLLSASSPGGIIKAGDIDNRLKTLFDALSIPVHKQQVPETPDTCSDGRVFCLLEDDCLITEVKVSNDRLLTEEDNSQNSLVIIRVRVTAFNLTLANSGIV